MYTIVLHSGRSLSSRYKIVVVNLCHVCPSLQERRLFVSKKILNQPVANFLTKNRSQKMTKSTVTKTASRRADALDATETRDLLQQNGNSYMHLCQGFIQTSSTEKSLPSYRSFRNVCTEWIACELGDGLGDLFGVNVLSKCIFRECVLWSPQVMYIGGRLK